MQVQYYMILDEILTSHELHCNDGHEIRGVYDDFERRQTTRAFR